ncbi:MAG: PAS domain S-box protein [Candidatus Bathyarchaeia archaeon]
MRSARGRAIKRRGRKGTIRESDFYRTIFETTGTAMIIIEEDTTISMVNSEFTRLWGYAKEEVEGKSWTEFIAKEDLERMLEYHQRRRIDPESVPRSYEFRGIDKNGNVRDVRITISMIPGTKKSIASLLDITDLKKGRKGGEEGGGEIQSAGREPERCHLQPRCEGKHFLYQPGRGEDVRI